MKIFKSASTGKNLLPTLTVGLLTRGESVSNTQKKPLSPFPPKILYSTMQEDCDGWGAGREDMLEVEIRPELKS